MEEKPGGEKKRIDMVVRRPSFAHTFFACCAPERSESPEMLRDKAPTSPGLTAESCADLQDV